MGLALDSRSSSQSGRRLFIFLKPTYTVTFKREYVPARAEMMSALMVEWVAFGIVLKRVDVPVNFEMYSMQWRRA